MGPADEKKEQLASLEREKAQMIARYMSLQDQADSVNEEIYRTCCGVETLNAQINALQKEMKRAALKTVPVNGKSHAPPANGKSHP